MLNNNEENDFKYYESDIQPLYEYFCSKHEWFNSINEDRQIAIIYLSFIGIKNLESFEGLIESLKKFDYHSASKDILNSNFSEKFNRKASVVSQALISGII